MKQLARQSLLCRQMVACKSCLSSGWSHSMMISSSKMMERTMSGNHQWKSSCSCASCCSVKVMMRGFSMNLAGRNVSETTPTQNHHQILLIDVDDLRNTPIEQSYLEELNGVIHKLDALTQKLSATTMNKMFKMEDVCILMMMIRFVVIPLRYCHHSFTFSYYMILLLYINISIYWTGNIGGALFDNDRIQSN